MLNVDFIQEMMGPRKQLSYSEDETDHGKGIGRLGLPESVEKWILRISDMSLLQGFGPILMLLNYSL